MLGLWYHIVAIVRVGMDSLQTYVPSRVAQSCFAASWTRRASPPHRLQLLVDEAAPRDALLLVLLRELPRERVLRYRAVPQVVELTATAAVSTNSEHQQ
jgi:hypothetical protein